MRHPVLIKNCHNLFFYVYKKYKSAKKTSSKYIEIFKNQKGSIYEYDAYTKLIEEAVKYIQQTQKVVLIIEDLDRIDPAHLFRILNVLGAHIDCKYSHEDCQPNKFGVDNIITVFDYDMTQHIFHHFYGVKANYEGYINKFKINAPFYYSINKAAKDYLIQYIEKECNVSAKSLNASNIKPIYSHITKLSVRDIQNILYNIEKQIQIAVIKSDNNEFTYNSVSSITLFIAILIRIGIKKADIEQYINLNIKDDELLNLLNTFLLSDNWFCLQSAIKYKEGYYDIKRFKAQNDTLINNVLFKRSNDLYSDSAKYINTSSAISNALKLALSYVNE